MKFDHTAYMRQWREENRDKHNQYSKNRYHKRKDDPDFKENQRVYYRRMKYGMEPGDYEKMYEAQEGKCLICKNEAYLHIDHDHNTSKVRGLLCVVCNTRLGWYEKQKESVDKYLEGVNW